jgi:hypothetical protein
MELDTAIALADLPADQHACEAGSSAVSRNTSRHPDHPEFSLPRPDGGKDAWLFLAACFVVEALVWGKISFYWS